MTTRYINATLNSGVKQEGSVSSVSCSHASSAGAISLTYDDTQITTHAQLQAVLAAMLAAGLSAPTIFARK